MNHQPASFNLVLQTGSQPGQTFAIHQHPQVIGRGQGSTIVIADKGLSRQHARVWAVADGVMVEDLASTNGTFVNGQRVSGQARLRPGDTLRLGDTITLTVQAPPDLDETYVSGGASNQFDHTFVPSTPASPVYAPAAQPAGSGLWLWVGIAVVLAVLIVAGALGYLYYLRTQPTPLPTLAAPVLVPTATTPLELTPSPTPEPLRVPGVAAAVAQQQAVPPEAVNKIDPLCNNTIEVVANEPVLVVWQQRLAQADAQTDYLAQWLAAAYYDLSLDGHPLTALNYQQEPGPTLTWWVNAGLLPIGRHHLRLQWYTSRRISSGLDLSPADGQVDTFGPGPAGEGVCELVVPEFVAATTPTPAPTFTPPPAPVEQPTPTPTRKVEEHVSTNPAPLGIFQDFESQSTWKRGDQPYGELTRSSAQVHSGSYAGQLSYNFPTNGNDYVVFLQSRALAGQPNAITAWVYGDGSGHFLNVWLKDAGGQTWAMSFGRVSHTGWKEMTAYIDPAQPWPSGHISGPDNKVIDYPISFQGLVLDDREDSYVGSGVIYIDDLSSQVGVIPATTPQVVAPPAGPASGGQNPPAGSIYILRLGNQHRYEEPWGTPKGDVCEAYRNNSWDDEHPNFRGFNVELLLTNQSAVKVQDDWGEGMHFFTANGQEVKACYYGYGGAGPAPNGTTSLTFFTVVPKGDYVSMMRLNLNGQSIQLCLDGRGGWSYCY